MHARTCVHMCFSLLSLITSTRRVKTSRAQGTGVVCTGSYSPSPQASGEGEGSDFSVSFPGSSASLGTQLHAREVTLDPAPCEPSSGPSGHGESGSPPPPHCIFTLLSHHLITPLVPHPTPAPHSPASNPCTSSSIPVLAPTQPWPLQPPHL